MVSRPTFERHVPRGERATRISCPDCAGVLGVRVDGDRGHSMFVCRVGHTFSMRDLLVGKEQQIEARLWSAVVALEELVEILDDFGQRARRQGVAGHWSAHGPRSILSSDPPPRSTASGWWAFSSRATGTTVCLG